MAHEIRTPLNIVLMGLTMLETKVGQRYYLYLYSIYTSTLIAS